MPIVSSNSSTNSRSGAQLHDTDYGIIQRDGGNQGIVMWMIRYENTGWGLARALPYERGFQRWMPTRYLIDLYDETVDQRWSNFRTWWAANSNAAILNWPATIYIDGVATAVDTSKVGTKMFAEGDTALVLYKHSWPRQRAQISASAVKKFDPDRGFLIYDINDMYLPDGSVNYLVNETKFYFPMWIKYTDTTKTAVTDEHSKRNVPVFRLAEMYLIAVEAQAKLGNANALTTLQTLANSRAIGNNGAALLSSYGISSIANITDDFILDERARELATEHLRFFDLKRFGEAKFLERIRNANPEAGAHIEGFHMLRPIPQEQLDAVYNKDEFTQNDGYN